MLRAILKSEEYVKRIYQKEKVWDHFINAPAMAETQQPKVRHIISLGTHCLTAALLRKYGLKPYSLPFDWLFSSPQAVSHCLQDDFLTFLDKRHYYSVTERRHDKSSGADHLFYRAHFGIGDMFAHRDPTEEQDYAYVKRTVQRFRTVLASDEHKLFVMIVGAKLQLGDHFEQLTNVLDRLTKNSVFTCVKLLSPEPTPECFSLKKLATEGPHVLYEFQPSSTENGVSFKDPIDELVILRLIRRFAIDLRPIQALETESN
jgi:hypothetical protein